MSFDYEPFPFKKHIVWGFLTLGIWHFVWPFIWLAHPSRSAQVKKHKKQQRKDNDA